MPPCLRPDLPIFRKAPGYGRDGGPWLLWKFAWFLLFVFVCSLSLNCHLKKIVINLIFDLVDAKSEVQLPDLSTQRFMTLNNHFISLSFLVCRKRIIKSFLLAGYKDEMRYPVAINQLFFPNNLWNADKVTLQMKKALICSRR